MKHGIYSIKDEATQVFNTPFVQLTNDAAMRQFGDLAQDAQTNVNKHPDDFTLYRVGSWDDDTGETEHQEKTKLASARDYNNEPTSA